MLTQWIAVAAFFVVSPVLVTAQTWQEIDFVKVGNVNNPGYSGYDPYNQVTGRGSMNYEYKIGRDEITTSQWMSFVNTFSTQSDSMVNFAWPIFWGAKTDITYQGPGRRWTFRTDVANPEMLPVAGITWREAAMFCNWLQNGRQSTLASIANGVYDTSTFTTNADHTFNDERAHYPGAKYWIPTLDEWLKAVHYDPNKFGPTQGGWWQSPNGTDDPLVPGPPGVGQANTGFRLANYAEWDIPLGAYPGTLSPYGLLDAAGASQDYLEDLSFAMPPQERLADGSYAGSTIHDAEDAVWGVSSHAPMFRGYQGLRIASIVPAPSPVVAVLMGGLTIAVRRRKSR